MSIRIAPGLGLTAALTFTLGLVGPPLAASADEASTSSFAQAQFLSGSLLGTDLDAIVALDPATAVNDGSVATVDDRNPLAVTALGAITVAPGAIRVDGVDGIDVGVIGQIASASDDGSSWAAVGAIGADGAIAVGDGDGATAVIDLAHLLGAVLGTEVVQLRLEAAGIAAAAEAALGEVHGESTIADLRLAVQLPAVTGLADRATTALAPIESTIAGLAGPTGGIATAIDDALLRSGSIGILGTGASIDVRVDVDLTGIVDGLRTGVLHDDALTVDLATGEILVDLNALTASPGINGLDPGTELLSRAVVAEIVAGIHRLLDQAVDEVVAAASAALRDARVSVAVDLSVIDSVHTGDLVTEIPTTVTYVVDRITGATLGIIDPATGVVTSLVPHLAGDDLGRLLNGTGGLLAAVLGLLGGVTTSVVTTVDTVVEPVFASLETAVHVRIDGTLSQLGSGTAANASAQALVLGLPVGIDASILLGDLSGLIGSTGVAADAVESVAPAVLAPTDTAIDGGDASLASILGGLVSVRAHVDETTATAAGETYTRTALRVSVLDGSLATVDLAAASVGPNVSGSDGGGTPTTPGGGTTMPGFAGLAFTGDALPILAILLALALLVTGAVLTARRRLAARAGHTGVMGTGMIPEP